MSPLGQGKLTLLPGVRIFCLICHMLSSSDLPCATLVPLTLPAVPFQYPVCCLLPYSLPDSLLLGLARESTLSSSLSSVYILIEASSYLGFKPKPMTGWENFRKLGGFRAKAVVVSVGGLRTDSLLGLPPTSCVLKVDPSGPKTATYQFVGKRLG